jgi:hypothetical protein
VLGCQVRPGTPNGQWVDSTNDALSHELFETTAVRLKVEQNQLVAGIG